MEDAKSAPSNRAVLISVVREGSGFRVSLDDAVRDAATPKLWRQAEHVTNQFVAAPSIESLQLSEAELADFGHYIFARLSAFVSRSEN